MTGKTENNQDFLNIRVDEDTDRRELFGNLDINLSLIGEKTGVEIFQRDNDLLIRGENKELAGKILEELIDILRTGETLDIQKVNYVISLVQEGHSYRESNISKDIICFTAKGKPLKAKTIGQKNYVNAIRKNDIVFGIGPAGTGKTYLAVAMAVSSRETFRIRWIHI